MLVVLTLAASGATRTVVDTDIVSISDSIQGHGRQVVKLKSGATYIVASIKPLAPEPEKQKGITISGEDRQNLLRLATEAQKELEVLKRTQQPRTVVVQQRPQQGYRPATRGDGIVDTALGIGAGIVIGDVVTDILGGLFD